MIAIGSTDLLFALDSIPATFGVTQIPYLVFAANAFALLGLRALYFLLKGLLDKLVYLSTGLALILAFIGFKLGLHWAHLQWKDVPEIGMDEMNSIRRVTPAYGAPLRPVNCCHWIGALPPRGVTVWTLPSRVVPASSA